MNVAFKTILVATDFSDQSALALEYARVLAEKFGAGLRIVHVVETPPALGSELFVPEVAATLEQAIERAQHRLAETLAGFNEDEVIGQVLVGHAARRIVEYAADHGVDLIVMGTHGRRALAHFIMGSVAERVVRMAPCPVFTVRHPAASRVTGEEPAVAKAS